MNPAHRLRVMYVVGNFVAGGAERHLLEMWSRIDRERFEVEIACFRREGQFLDEVEALGWRVRDLRIGSRLYGASGVLGFFRLVSHVLNFRPDVLHGYLFGPNLLAALAGRLTGVPALVAKRNVDAFETPRQVRVQRFTLRLAAHVTAVSEAVAETARALGVPDERITVIPNGVDSARFHGVAADRGALGVNGTRHVIGSVGCLAPRKDYGTLLDALAILREHGREFNAVLIGDGPERGALEHRARELGLEARVRFLGERPDIERLLPAMDVFVLSSREEGIPNALLEAMAAGRPAVASAVGGTAEVMTDGETGWLVPPSSAPALAQALEDVLARPDEARRRGEAARSATVARMDIGTMVRHHESLYRRIAGARRAR